MHLQRNRAQQNSDFFGNKTKRGTERNPPGGCMTFKMHKKAQKIFANNEGRPSCIFLHCASKRQEYNHSNNIITAL